MVTIRTWLIGTLWCTLKYFLLLRLFRFLNGQSWKRGYEPQDMLSSVNPNNDDCHLVEYNAVMSQCNCALNTNLWSLSFVELRCTRLLFIYTQEPKINPLSHKFFTCRVSINYVRPQYTVWTYCLNCPSKKIGPLYDDSLFVWLGGTRSYTITLNGLWLCERGGAHLLFLVKISF